jgi:hypothetical protein
VGQHVEFRSMIREMEAVLIEAIALQNISQTRFPKAQLRQQVRLLDGDGITRRIARPSLNAQIG